MRLLKETGQNILTGFPPFNLIPSVISIIRQFSAASILALPLWPSSPWWPLLSKGQHFFPFVHGCRVLPRLQNLLTPGPSTASAPRAFTRWRWTFLAVLCFSANPPPQPIPIPSYACRTQQVHPWVRVFQSFCLVNALHLTWKLNTRTLWAAFLSHVVRKRCLDLLNAHWFCFRSCNSFYSLVLGNNDRSLCISRCKRNITLSLCV